MTKLEKLEKKAKALNDTKRFKETIDLLTDEILAQCESPHLYAEKAQAYYRIGKKDLCLKAAEKALSINSKHAKANNYIGNVYLDFKQYEKSIEAYQKAIKADPQFVYPYNALGIVYENLKQYDKAIWAYQKAIEVDAKFANPYNGLGSVYDDLKQYTKAIEAYQKAIEINPQFAYPYNGLGIVYENLKQYDKAIEAYRKAIEADEQYASPYNGLGSLYDDLKQYDKAIEAYQKAIKIDPQNAYAYNGIGIVYKNLKQYDKAIEAYQKAIKIDPEYAYVYNGIGNVYDDLSQYDKAIEAYQKAIKIDPQYAYAYNGIGIVYKNLKQYGKAIEAYQKAIEADPNYSDPYYNKARLHFDTEQYRMALPDYKKYIEITKDNPDYYTSIAKSRVVELKKLIDNADYSFIRELVNKIKSLLLFTDDCITHYTSVSVTKALIMGQSLFRLSEGAYLNDTSEGRELFEYLHFRVTPNDGNDTVAEPFAKKPFIGSFVSESKHDDLTLWRMYGKEAKEEAKGCAITIVKDKFLNNLKEKLNSDSKTTSSLKSQEEFGFYRVAYRRHDKEKQFIIPGSEEKEDELNKLMEDLFEKVKTFRIKKRQKIADIQNLLELLNEIAYLFKSAAYQYEHELRLVIKGIGFEKNISTDFNPPRVYIELIPITAVIEKITLGPKVERADEWASAFYYSLDKQELYPEILISHLPFK